MLWLRRRKQICDISAGDAGLTLTRHGIVHPKQRQAGWPSRPVVSRHHSAVVISLIVVVLDTEHLEPVNRTDLTGLHTLDSNFLFDSNHRNHGLTLLRTVQKRWLCCCTNLLTIHKPLWPASYCYASHGTAACQITLRRFFFRYQSPFSCTTSAQGP